MWQVGTITLIALTGLLIFMFFLLVATTNAVVVSVLMSLAAAGGFLAMFFACLVAVYIGVVSVAVFVISATVISAIVGVMIATGTNLLSLSVMKTIKSLRGVHIYKLVFRCVS